MNAPYNAQPKPATITEARSTCRELLTLLVEENEGLSTNQRVTTDERVQNKRRLTLRLEQILSELKQKGSLWKSDPSARQQAALLAEEIAAFQELAKTNAMMLKAAHQLRADLIMAIRDTVDAHQPRVQTYGSNGTMNQTESASRLVARTI